MYVFVGTFKTNASVFQEFRIIGLPTLLLPTDSVLLDVKLNEKQRNNLLFILNESLTRAAGRVSENHSTMERIKNYLQTWCFSEVAPYFSICKVVSSQWTMSEFIWKKLKKTVIWYSTLDALWTYFWISFHLHYFPLKYFISFITDHQVVTTSQSWLQ